MHSVFDTFWFCETKGTPTRNFYVIDKNLSMFFSFFTIDRFPRSIAFIKLNIENISNCLVLIYLRNNAYISFWKAFPNLTIYSVHLIHVFSILLIPNSIKNNLIIRMRADYSAVESLGYAIGLIFTLNLKNILTSPKLPLKASCQDVIICPCLLSHFMKTSFRLSLLLPHSLFLLHTSNLLSVLCFRKLQFSKNNSMIFPRADEWKEEEKSKVARFQTVSFQSHHPLRGPLSL